jgi:hypothetical protein
MAIKKKQARDRSKEKTVEVPRHAAKVFKKRQDQLDARKTRKRVPKEDFSQAMVNSAMERTRAAMYRSLFMLGFGSCH